MALKIKHIELRDANEFVKNNHRHHNPVIGHRFSVACYNDEKLVGVINVSKAGSENDRPYR